MAKKAKSPKLPKRIAGVKVPKRMRKPGGRVMQALRNPFVADIAAAAVISAAAALGETKAAKKAKAKAGDAAHRAGERASSLGSVVAACANEGAKRMRSAYHELAGDGGAGLASGGGGRKSSKGKQAEASA